MKTKSTPSVILASALAAAAMGAAIANQGGEVAIPSSAREAAHLANLKVGHEWTYEYKWPNGQTSLFLTTVDRAIPVQDGVVYELRINSRYLNGQPSESFRYQRVTAQGVFENADSGNNTRRGFGESQRGALIPSRYDPGTRWRWTGAPDGVSTNARHAKSTFNARVLTPVKIETLAGKRTATVIETEEKVQWHVVITRSYYVPGLGLVREERRRPDGLLESTLTLKGFRPTPSTSPSQGGIDTVKG